MKQTSMEKLLSLKKFNLKNMQNNYSTSLATTIFFVFIFPLFFSYLGIWGWGAFGGTISLIVGTIGWLIYIGSLSYRFFLEPKKVMRTVDRILRTGPLVSSKILDKQQIGNTPNELNLKLEFQNLSNTTVNVTTEIFDIEPDKKRFEVGKTIDIRLNTFGKSPLLLPNNSRPIVKNNKLTNLLIILLVVVYMVLTFIAHYFFFSEGRGWGFLSLYHPWVLTPFGALLLNNLSISKIGKYVFGGVDSDSESWQYILYGKHARAVIKECFQTGTFINEQPMMQLQIQFTDNSGKLHHVSFKRLVYLNELAYFIEGAERDILYMEKEPDKIMLV